MDGSCPLGTPVANRRQSESGERMHANSMTFALPVVMVTALAGIKSGADAKPAFPSPSPRRSI